MNGATVSLWEVEKDYGTVGAVRGVSLDIGPGEFLTLLGPSGSGKTTTLMMIAGFEDPTGGDIAIDGVSVVGVSPHRRNIGMVFQNYALFPHMTVAENIAFPLKQRGVSKADRTRMVTEALDLVRLPGYGERYPKQLSGGQQQRVALARSIVFKPRLLLMDEPLGALDKQLRESLQLEMRRLHGELGITFVYVTHDQEEALTMSDRIAVMNAGVIEQLAPPREIYEHPKTRFVAGFIGTSNLLSGTVARTSGKDAVLDFGDGERIIVPAADAAPGDRLEITVRPEKITLSSHASADSTQCALRGTVTEAVYLGTSTNFNVTTTAGAEVVVFTQNTSAATAQGQVPQRGDTVWLHWDPANSYAIGSVQ